MFDWVGLDEGGIAGLDADAALTTAAQLRATSERAEALLLQVAAHFADLHPDPFDNPDTPKSLRSLPGDEESKVYGGDGCPSVAEFAPAELGAVLGITSYAAARLIGDALALRHRLPKTWTRVLAGEVQAWRARQIASTCWQLSKDAAALVDARVADIAQSLTSYRLAKVVRAAVLEADPETAEQNCENETAGRGVWVDPADSSGSKAVFVKAAAGDVIRFDASIDLVANILGELGDADHKDLRRAKAIGWLANPQATLNLWHTYQQTNPPDPTTPPSNSTNPEAHPGQDSHVLGQGVVDAMARGGGCATADPRDATAGEPAREAAEEPSGEATDEPAREATEEPAGEATEEPGGGAVERESGPVDRCAELRRQGWRGDSLMTGLGRYTLYVHLTDLTLASGEGLVRVGDSKVTQRHAGRDGVGPMFAKQLAELIGHPELVEKITVKPVIDLAEQVAVDSYEIPRGIRERVLLRYPRCIFPHCNRPATPGIDLDHITPYDHGSTGPPGQTSTENLGPLCRFHHRVKTHGRWKVRRLSDGAFEWTSPHGRLLRVDHTGTHVVKAATRAGSRSDTRTGSRSDMRLADQSDHKLTARTLDSHDDLADDEGARMPEAHRLARTDDAQSDAAQDDAA